LLAGRPGQLQRPPGYAGAGGLRPEAQPTLPRPRLVTIGAGEHDAPPAEPEPSAPRTLSPTPPRGVLAERGDRPSTNPIAIRVSSAVGFEPLLLVYTAEVPPDWQRTATFTWYLDEKRIGDGLNGQRTMTAPGDYTLEVLVRTAEGAIHKATRRIRVLKSMTESGAPVSSEGARAAVAAGRPAAKEAGHME
ncbi:MAG: hypothetical protein AB1716_19080, partial [Planctomycetota bacterium]